MKFLDSPIAFVSALCVAIFVFGLGLTSPIWFLVDGKGPLQAVHEGTPIVVITIIGLIITGLIGTAAHRLRRPMEFEEIQTAAAVPADDHRKHVIVHILVSLMFIVPFLTIVVGYLLKRVIDFSAG